MKCGQKNCDNKHHARSMCKTHYSRWLRGESLSEPIKSLRNTSVESRISHYSRRSGECLVWTGRTTDNGYPQMRIDGATRRVHRVVYELYFGEIQDGLEVDHTCRNTKCINPGHLDAVTKLENNRRKKLTKEEHFDLRRAVTTV